MIRLRFLPLFSMVVFFASAGNRSSVYQFSVPVGNRTAYLWLPEKCQYVRGLIIAYENMLERNWLESPIIRRAAEKEGLGIIWLADGKPTGITWETKAGVVDSLQLMFDDLANVSGYSEIKNAPLIVTGHSWNGRIAWTYTNANPDRVIAAMPIRTYPMPDSLNFYGIPLCYMVGQTTELPQYNDGRPGDRDFFWPVVRKTALALRAQNENQLIGVVVYPGGTHTDWDDVQSKFVALFIRKACRYRLPADRPADGKVTLNPVDKEAGWLTDAAGMEPDLFEPASYKQYKGDPKKAYWFFDEEMARAAVKLGGDRKKREMQMPTFTQNGEKLPVARSGYVEIPFKPHDDGITFRLGGAFLDEVPEGLSGAGIPLNHGHGMFRFCATSGSVKKNGKRTFQLGMDRQAFRKPQVYVIHNGTKRFRRALQPAYVHAPAKQTNGRKQTINFPAIANQSFGTRRLKMNASSSAGLPVYYYVKAGPAFVKGDQLLFTEIPPRSGFPIEVTVVAWQYGTKNVQTADPVEQRFFINEANIKKH